MGMMRNVIAVDGPSGVGKSSVCKQLAKKMDWTYLDTGAMYRAVTLAWIGAESRPGLLHDDAWLDSLDLDISNGKMKLDGRFVHKEIRGAEVTDKVSQVAAAKRVRAKLTQMQRRIAERKPCILDGRDIGTVVFPEAFLKVFLTADPGIRAERRWKQLGGTESGMTLQEVLADQERRDREDRERDIAPLVQADDAWVLNTDHLDQEQVVESIWAEAKSRGAADSA